MAVLCGAAVVAVVFCDAADAAAVPYVADARLSWYHGEAPGRDGGGDGSQATAWPLQEPILR